MSEISNIVEELRQIQDSENAWHGPGLNKILNGVTAEAALARPVPEYRSIWELVLHISKWEGVFCERLQGHAMKEPLEGDWPAIGETGEKSWQIGIRELQETHDQMIEIVSRLRETDLQKIVAGKDYSIAYMLHGIVRHHVYHSGQIALLKRFVP